MAKPQPIQQDARQPHQQSGPTAFNLMKWVAENPDKLKPPLGAKTIFREDDFMVTVVGGPNARTDYHINPTEEFFFQLKGTVNIRIQHEGRPHDIALPEGSIKAGMKDTHRWYCESCNAVLFEKTVQIEILERDMPPIFDAYYGDPDHQKCKACGHVNPGRPKRG